MNLSQHVASLPAPMPGHTRGLRIESKDDFMVGASCANSDGWQGWWTFRPPYDDGAPEGFHMDGRVCATYAHNFHHWFTPEQLESLSSTYRVVALDIPDDKAVKCCSQIVFSRADAHEVAVLIQ